MSKIVTIAYTSTVVDDMVVIQNSEGGKVWSDDLRELIEMLAHNYGEGLNKKWTWDIDVFIAPILKVMGYEFCSRLVIEPDCEVAWRYVNGEVELLDGKPEKLPPNTYYMYYHRGTSFGIKAYGHRDSYFYNLSQFMENVVEDVTDLDEILKGVNEFVDTCFGMNLNPMKSSSMISIYESNVLKYAKIPSIDCIDENLPEDDCNTLLEWCEYAIHRNWTSNAVVGYWNKGESYLYDQRSSYGYHLSNVPDIEHAFVWRRSEPAKDADWGIMLGKITINPDVTCSPICFTNGAGQVLNPVGQSWVDIITLPEVRWMYRNHIGSFELYDAIYVKYRIKNYPFRNFINRMYEYRKKGELYNRLAKRVIASMWGKTIQKRTTQGFNPNYNPISAIQVLTDCRLSVADFIYKNNLQDSVLYTATDGVRTTREVEIPYNEAIGAWRQEPDDEVLIISPGRITTNEKKPSGLYLNQIKELIQEKPNATVYKTSKARPLTLAEAVINGDINKTGVMTDIDITLDILSTRTDQDYDYEDYPSTGKELITGKYYGTPKTISEDYRMPLPESANILARSK